MPLIPRDFGGEVEVEIDGDTYYLRRYLGWYHRERTNQARAVAMHLPYGKVKSGDIDVEDRETVPVTVDGLADMHLQRLKAWLVRWSHNEPISENTLKRLPKRHADLLLERIEALEEEQDGPAEGSPLPSS